MDHYILLRHRELVIRRKDLLWKYSPYRSIVAVVRRVVATLLRKVSFPPFIEQEQGRIRGMQPLFYAALLFCMQRSFSWINPKLLLIIQDFLSTKIYLITFSQATLIFVWIRKWQRVELPLGHNFVIVYSWL